MSPHEHMILTDRYGQLPRFLQELHRMLALGIKVLRKWEGAVWDHEKTSVVELRTQQAVVEKLAYVMANPVAAGLVRRAVHWPGITTQPDQLGRAAWTAARPKFYFDEENTAWPTTATLHLTMPPRLDITDATLRAAVAAELEQLESAAHQEVRARGWRVVGRKKLASLSPYDRASSWEPLRGCNPAFAVGRGQRRRPDPGWRSAGGALAGAVCSDAKPLKTLPRQGGILRAAVHRSISKCWSRRFLPAIRSTPRLGGPVLFTRLDRCRWGALGDRLHRGRERVPQRLSL
jgi:putative transposase